MNIQVCGFSLRWRGLLCLMALPILVYGFSIHLPLVYLGFTLDLPRIWVRRTSGKGQGNIRRSSGIGRMQNFVKAFGRGGELMNSVLI